MAPRRTEDRLHEALRERVNLTYDRIPLPTPHWENNLEVATESGDDWILFNVDNHAEHVILGDGRGSYIFDLEEVR